MLSKYKNSQKLFYDYFMNSNDSGHLSHAYLIESNGVSYSNSLAIDLAKFFLCNGIYDEKVCSLVDAGNYSNFRIVGFHDSVKKEDIVSLKTDFSMKAVNNKRLVYVIYDVQNLNKSAANSLLKFLEEPDNDVFAILVCDNCINVLPTISSRCQTISLINDDNYYDGVFAPIFDNNSDMNFNEFVLNKSLEYFNIYNCIEYDGISILKDSSIYAIKDEINEFLIFGYYLYYDSLNYLLGRNTKCDSLNIDIKKIAEKNSSHDIIKKMEIINKFISYLKYNVNINLFIDNFIISIGSV